MPCFDVKASDLQVDVLCWLLVFAVLVPQATGNADGCRRLVPFDGCFKGVYLKWVSLLGFL